MALPAFAALRHPAAHAAAVTYGQLMPDRRLPSQPPLNRYRIYCLVTEASACEQLAQGCYLKAEQPRIEPAPFQSQVQHPNHYMCSWSGGCNGFLVCICSESCQLASVDDVHAAGASDVDKHLFLSETQNAVGFVTIYAIK